MPEAYTYDADTHCPECAEYRFGRCTQHNAIACCVEDSEGNEPGAIFSWDEWDGCLCCGDCGEHIRDAQGCTTIGA